MKIKVKALPGKMGPEELQSYLKAKRQGNGVHKNKKAYNRKRDKQVS